MELLRWIDKLRFKIVPRKKKNGKRMAMKKRNQVYDNVKVPENQLTTF